MALDARAGQYIESLGVLKDFNLQSTNNATAHCLPIIFPTLLPLDTLLDMSSSDPIPITIITGFLGSGKTTLILHLLPQLPPTYRLALLKNEYGDLAIDSQLTQSTHPISGVRELLGGCICCNLVGQLSDALATLRNDVHPDRIVIETSGSAFPATLAMEINRLGRETGWYTLDGVVSVIDVENWKGYEDTSYTARMQAKFTDLVVLNKWEGCEERRVEDVLDRIGDLEVQVAVVKSVSGKVDKGLLLGLDGALAKGLGEQNHAESHGHGQMRDHHHDHQQEVEVLSVTVHSTAGQENAIDLEALETLLLSAPKDEVYRIKAIVNTSKPPADSDGTKASNGQELLEMGIQRYILNWAFGRWTFTRTNIAVPQPSIENLATSAAVHVKDQDQPAILRMTIIAARGESDKWKKRIENGGQIHVEGGGNTKLEVQRLL